MSVISDLRTALEDAVSPTLREVKVRIESNAASLDQVNKRLDRLDTRLERLDSALHEGFADLRRQLDTAERVRVLEMEMAALRSKRDSAA